MIEAKLYLNDQYL